MPASAKQRSDQSPGPTAVVEKPVNTTTVVGATKENAELLESVITTIEEDLDQETHPKRQENIRAVLRFVQDNGYPKGDLDQCSDPATDFCIWAMDGVAKCQTEADMMLEPWPLASPGCVSRGQVEGYMVVSSSLQYWASRQEGFSHVLISYRRVGIACNRLCRWNAARLGLHGSMGLILKMATTLGTAPSKVGVRSRGTASGPHFYLFQVVESEVEINQGCYPSSCYSHEF